MKIVCFGGGNSITKAVIPGLRDGSNEITTITSMTDSGGSSGELRKEFNVLPPGDLRRHLISLSNAPEWKKKLFDFRFGSEEFCPGHRGHNLGNVILACLEKNMENYGKVLDFVHDFLEVEGRCLPATTDKVQLCAELQSGEIVRGEDEIDVPKTHDPLLRIRRVFLVPPAKVYQDALNAVKKADMIIMGPGDLYSSILPCFLPEGMKEAFQKSSAKKVFICPALTKHGETDEFSVSDFANEAEKYSGKIDFFIYNSQIPGKASIRSYRKEYPAAENIVKIDDNLDRRFIGEPLLSKSDKLIYDPKKLSKIIMKLK